MVTEKRSLFQGEGFIPDDLIPEDVKPLPGTRHTPNLFARFGTDTRRIIVEVLELCPDCGRSDCVQIQRDVDVFDCTYPDGYEHGDRDDHIRGYQ